MTLLRHDRNVIYFAHIPKTGGSSVEFALREAGAARALHFHKRLGFTSSTIQHMHAEVYSRLVPADFYDYGLAVIRHPLSRLVSEYKWRIQLGQAKLKFDPWVVRHLALFRSNPYVLDNHIRPQVEFLHSSIEVFRFEDGIASALEAGARALGLSGVDLGTHRRAGDPLEVSWAASTRQLALEFYHRDFVELGYDPEIEIPGLHLT